MQRSKKIFIVCFLAVLGFSFFTFGAMAAGSIFGGLETARNTAGYSAGTTVESQVGNIISVVLEFVGVIFLGLMLYGGFIWMIARGNEQEVEKAKRVLESAVIGLAVVLAAYAITYFVLQRFAGLGGTGTGACPEGQTKCVCSSCTEPPCEGDCMTAEDCAAWCAE